ncbi:MAG TPA: thiol peroxidase [Armatimonadota bacterium]|jgi:thiol peroxidase
MAEERKGAVTFKGNPMTLVGPELKEGQPAPDFHLLDKGLGTVSLAASQGKVRILSVVPSLDTSVCAIQTKRFNDEAAKLPADVVLYTISADLPFAQARFCSTEGTDRITTLSDHRDMSFGEAYGVLLKELRLESRSVFVVGRDGTLKHAQIVPEVTHEPNYQAVLDAAKAAV